MAMMPSLENTLPMVIPYLMPVIMVAPRLLGLHMALPMFGPASVPPQVRHSLSLSLALFLLPLMATQEKPDLHFLSFAAVSLKEFFLGFAFGYPIALLNWAAQSAGDLVSMQSGASMASHFDPASQTESSPMGSLLMRFAEVIFFISGAYTFLLGALFDSYRLWPIASYFPDLGAGGAAFFTAAMGKYFAAACLMAFPAMACMFLITFCLALIGRYVPQLNVFFLAMPIQCITAVGVMILCIPIYARMFDTHFGRILESLSGLDRIFGN
jgi:type III secretion protein T